MEPIHVYFLSPNPLNFDDNQPFKQVIRELIDIPLAYSMFWIVQLLVMTTSIIDDDHQKPPPNNSNISRLKNLINVCSEYVQHILYYIGRNTWSLYLGHLILQDAINFDYIPRLSFINRDKSRLLHFSILFGKNETLPVEASVWLPQLLIFLICSLLLHEVRTLS